MLKCEIPYTLGYDLDRAVVMLKGHEIIIDETSTPFKDKQEERKENTPIVVRQQKIENHVRLTVSRFK